MKLVKACIALAAFAAFLVVPSIASAAPTLTQTTANGTNHVVPAGTSILATNVAHAGTEKPTRMTAGGLEVVCQTATLTGSLETNTGTHIAGNITTAEFFAKPGNHIKGAPCASLVGDTTPTPNHTTVPSHNGSTSLPWCVTANTLNDKLSVRGGACNEAARPLFFQLHIPGFSCVYSREQGLTATYTTHPADAVATVDAGQPFKKVTGGVFCPNEGSLDMAFTMTTDAPGEVDGEPLNVT
jgi:hypothetical protein